jgi:membrane protease YdiL (CAAX protease family)
MIILRNIRARRFFGKTGLSIVVYHLVGQFGSAIPALVALSLFPQLQDADWFYMTVSYAFMCIVAFPVYRYLMNSLPDTRREVDKRVLRIEAKQYAPLAFACVGIMISLNYLTEVLTWIFVRFTGVHLENALDSVLNSSLPILVTVVIVGPVLEELVFRWIPYKRLAGFGCKSYILYTSAVFALSHFNFAQMLYAFAIGIVFSYITWKTDSPKTSIILHIVLNLLGGGVGLVLSQYFSERAQSVYSAFLIAVCAIGILVIIWWFRQNRGKIVLEIGELGTPGVRDVIVNSGNVLFLLLVIALSVLTQVGIQFL